MPETSSPADEAAPSPSTVGNTFMRQYYHFLAKEPQSLHRFYKAESRWCHGLGSHMEEPIAGQRAINEQILKRGYAGARVDLDAGSIDCQNSLGGGVLVLVTGVMTLQSSTTPKPFVQTFFLAVQPKGFFVLNDCLRFLELPGTDVATDKQLKDQTPASPAKNGKKTETQAPTSPVKKVKKEESVPTSPEKVASPVKTEIKTTTKKVVKDAPLASPVKTTATVASSPVKKTTTTTTTTTTTKEKETPAAKVVKAASPVKVASPVKSPIKSPKEQEKAPAAASPAPASAPAAVPADPVVPAPTEPEKPKTWAALFSGPKPATITPTPAATAPVSAPAKPSTPKAAPAAAPVTAPVPDAIAPATGAVEKSEKSPKNKSGNGKEKEHKRLYSLFIRDVPPQTREGDLRELFKGFGSIAGVSVVAPRGFAFVDYYEQESMRAALAETKEFKVFDKVLQVDERAERKEGQRGGFRGNDSRGRGRGPKGGRGDRKERSGDDAPPSNKGDRREGPRREKTGNRRGGKVDATSQNRSE
ncbi:hypothetical protein PRNP1_000866 [Phytophthora ramorum]